MLTEATDAEKAELNDALGLTNTPPETPPDTPPPPKQEKDEASVAPKKEKVKQVKANGGLDLDLPDGLITPPATPKKKAPSTPIEDDSHKDLGLSEKQNKAFSKMRDELKAARMDLEKARATPPLPETKDNPEHRQTIETLKKQLAESYDKLGQISLEADPRFQAQFNGAQQAVIAEIKTTLKDFESDEGLAERLVSLSRRQRNELLTEEAPDASVPITTLLMQYDKIERDKNDALKNHNAMTEVLSREQQKQQAVVNQQVRGQLFKESLEQLTADGSFILNPIEGNDAWNNGVAKVQQRVKYLFTADDAPAQTQALIMGAAAPVYLTMLKKEHTRRVELEKQLKQRQSMRAPLDSRTPPQSDVPKKEPDEMSPEEAGEMAWGS